MRRFSLRKALLITIGLISIGIGTIGIFVPLLPTTVFLLIAAACFVRSSERLHTWLMTHRVFGSYIRNYREHRAMDTRTRASILVALWLTLATSAYLVGSLAVRLMLAAVGIGVTIHLLSPKKPVPESRTAGEGAEATPAR